MRLLVAGAAALLMTFCGTATADYWNFSGTPGQDFYYAGTPWGENIKGGDGVDTLRGYLGDDRVYGQGDDDSVTGDDGNDIVSGGPGHDSLGGGLGADRLYARDGQRDHVDCGGNKTDTLRDVVIADRGDILHNCGPEDVIRVPVRRHHRQR
jgi:Ca2+-binding RTX toxin-like protein